MSVTDYLKKYCNKELREDDTEYNMVLIGNFIYEFGKYLAEYVNKFNLSNVSRLINENSYYEAISIEDDDGCKIKFSYIDFNNHIEDTVLEKVKEFSDKAYFISPLGRIAIKFGSRPEKLMYELYNDDIALMILNELFNNNIKVILVEENVYEVSCKYKSFSSVISMITAILNDIFYTMFETKIDIKLECIVRE